MPLSEQAIHEVREAADAIGARLWAVEADSPQSRWPTADALRPHSRALLETATKAGVELHYPSVLAFRGGKPVGAAIVGFRESGSYERIIRSRLLGGADLRRSVPRASAWHNAVVMEEPIPSWRDIPVDGRPGPYFRYIRGAHALAYEVEYRTRVMRIADATTVAGPGHIDAIPSPDGAFFVSAGPERDGIYFYGKNGTSELDFSRLIYVDSLMKDQYPTVGMLDDGEGIYRVISSHETGLVFRDYRISVSDASVLAVGPPTVACEGLFLSLPVLSPRGDEVAVRNEDKNLTEIYSLDDAGGCVLVEQLPGPTGKVAFSPDADMVAFAVPLGAAGEDGTKSGVLVLNRLDGSLRQVFGSSMVDRLTFPEFVGPDTIVFLKRDEDGSRFRLACCIESFSPEGG